MVKRTLILSSKGTYNNENFGFFPANVRLLNSFVFILLPG